MPEIQNLHPAVAAGIVVLVFVLATIAAWAGRRLLRESLAAQDVVDPISREAVQARARQLLRGVKLLAYGTASVASAALLAWEFRPKLLKSVPRTPEDLFAWVFDPGIRIGLIVVAAYITVRSIHLWIEYLEYRFTSDAAGPSGLERKRRARTLSGTLASAFTVAIAFAAGLMVLQQLNINVLPLLTAAGIGGLAIGFGAQNLVRDVISGFFLILEDQVRIGDLAQIQNVTGLVEEINLRTIVLRDADGAVHVFPNGSIATLANLSKDFSFAVVDLVVPLAEDFRSVRRVVCEIGERMQADPTVGPMILGPIEVLGLETMTETTGTLRVRFKTLPLKQYAVARELRWRIVTEFAEQGIKP